MNFIGLDLGTSAVKGVVVDGDGAVLAVRNVKNTVVRPREGWVELEPEQHYRDVTGVIRGLVEASPGDIAGIAMAAASGNTLLTDADGSPMTNIISWMDARAALDPPSAIAGVTAETMRRVVGWPCVDIFPFAHLAWLKDNEPAKLAAADHVCMNTDWLLFKLTGKWMMDHSTATTFHLQNQLAGEYHKPFLESLGIDESKLSPLVHSGIPVGAPTAQAAADTGLGAGALFATGCFDHPAAAGGVCVERPGQLLLSCGTSWVGFLPEFDRRRIIDAELLCDPFLSADGGPWAGMFSIPRIGGNIDWYIDNLIAPGCEDKYASFEESAKLAEAGAGGLTLDLTAPPAKIADSPANIARAVMEGAARLLRERLDDLRKRGFEFSEAVMTGGPSKSRLWPGIVEEFTGLSIGVGSEFAGAVGAAKLARRAADI
jgi:sugar (pentulose or hexulose) kinase